METKKLVIAGAVFLFILCLIMPSCNPPTEDEPNLGGGIEQETLLIVDDPMK